MAYQKRKKLRSKKKLAKPLKRVKSKYSRKRIFRSIKLRKISSFLTINSLSLLLENILYNIVNENCKVYLFHMVQSFNKTKIPFFLIKKFKVRFELLMMYFSFYWFNSEVLASHIHDLVKNTKLKQHVRNLRFFAASLKFFFSQQILIMGGIKFQVTGKLGGKMRKSKYKFRVGKVSLFSLESLVSYTNKIVHTKYGVFSIKI